MVNFVSLSGPDTMAAERAEGDPDACPTARDDVDSRILQAVRSLDYGSVEVVVHDSRVVQIERREKVRFDEPGTRRTASGASDSRRSRQSKRRAE